MKAYIVTAGTIAEDKFTVLPTSQVYGTIKKIRGSVHRVKSQLFGLEYQDYQKMVIQVYNGFYRPAKISLGEDLFNSKIEAQKLCDELNRRWDSLMKGIN